MDNTNRLGLAHVQIISPNTTVHYSIGPNTRIQNISPNSTIHYSRLISDALINIIFIVVLNRNSPMSSHVDASS